MGTRASRWGNARDYFDPDKRAMKPATMIVLPSRDARRSNRARFNESVRSKVWVESLGDYAPTLDDLREHVDAHWRWTGAMNGRHGTIRILGERRPVSRVLWTLFRGGSPTTAKVVHRTCDREGCVNPHHAMLTYQGWWKGQIDAKKRELGID